MAKYFRKLSEIIDVPAPDDLVQGVYDTDIITIATPGEYRAGMLLVSDSGAFVPATASNVAGADEICILADSFTLTEGEISVTAYFVGTFFEPALILPYQTEDDDRAELIEAIRPSLRKHGIFLK